MPPAGLKPRAGFAPPTQTNGPALPLFRKEFIVAAPLRNATLRVVGLGDYAALI